MSFGEGCGAARAEPAPVAPASAGSTLTLRDLALGYDRRPVLERLSGTVARGELLALVGPNGAGKSTLLKGIVGESSVLAGSLDRHGTPIRDIAYLPQRAEIDRSFPIAVDDFVSMGLWRRTGAWRPIGGSGRAVVRDALGRVGLAGSGRRAIGALSGGEMQRVLFARTLVQDCGLVLLDEPFAGMDERTTADLLDLVALWHREGRTVLAALHDMDQVRARFPRTLLLGGAGVAWGPTASVLPAGSLPDDARGRGIAASGLRHHA